MPRSTESRKSKKSPARAASKGEPVGTEERPVTRGDGKPQDERTGGKGPGALDGKPKQTEE